MLDDMGGIAPLRHDPEAALHALLSSVSPGAGFDREALEEALRSSEEGFRATFENAAVGIAHVGLDGRWLAINERLCQITGYSREELLASDFQAITHPADLDNDLQLLRRVAAGELDTYSIEKRYLRRDASEVWVNLTVSARRDRAGKPVFFISVVEDISRRKRAEQALQAALQASETGTFRWEIQTNRLDWDDALDRLFGLLPGDSVRDFAAFLARVHPDDRAGVIERCERCRTEGANFEMEFRVVWPDGSERWLYDRGRTFRDAAGRPAYMTGACVDITERRHAEQALRDADRQKDEFLATLAHELRNPLAPLRNALEILRRQGSVQGAGERPLAIMDRQLRHLVRLVDDLMDVSRIRTGKIELRRERVDLVRAVEHAVESAQTVIRAAGHRLDVQPPGAPLWVHGDLTRLSQVLGNLLNNAAKYTPPGGHLQIAAHASDGEAVVEVRDDGVGLTPDMLSRVFDLFVQVEDTRGLAQGGLGIGLSLVKRLVELHGGRIEALSDGPGRGASFIVRLPLAEPAAAGDQRAGAGGAAVPLPTIASTE